MNFLALDHRALFERLCAPFGPSTYQRIVELKQVVYEAYVRVNHSGIGLLVDEHYGAAIALDARRRGVTLAMPVEQNETRTFALEYGDDFSIHVAAFEPDWVKALFRYEPLEDRFGRSLDDLVAVASSCSARPLLLELIPQDGDRERLGAEIAHLLSIGLAPAAWKIPLPSHSHLRTVVEVVRSAPGAHAEILALGGGESLIDATSTIASATRSRLIDGWAVGRAVWHEPLCAMVAGTATRKQAASEIAVNLLSLVEVFDPGGTS